MTEVQLLEGGIWQSAWTKLTTGSPREAVSIAVQLAGAMDDLMAVFTEPPGKLALRLLHFVNH